MEISQFEFNEFITWLKNDGLSPKKSERLWKKKIFSNLCHDDPKTLENYEDYLNETKIKKLLGKNFCYESIDSIITGVELSDSRYIVKTLDNHNLIVHASKIDMFIKIVYDGCNNG